MASIRTPMARIQAAKVRRTESFIETKSSAQLRNCEYLKKIKYALIKGSVKTIETAKVSGV